METKDLIKILGEDIKTRQIFKGVYARDEFCNLPELRTISPRSSTPILFVCNLDKSNEPGSHWVVIEYNKNSGKTMYFDPYGFPPIHQDIINKLFKESTSLSWSDIQLQETNTTVCGQYCTIYCLLRARGSTSTQILDLLYCDGLISNDTRDHLIYNFLKSLYPTKLSNFQTDVHDIDQFL